MKDRRNKSFCKNYLTKERLGANNPETRNQKPETRNQKPETRNQKPETRNQKPETSLAIILH